MGVGRLDHGASTDEFGTAGMTPYYLSAMRAWVQTTSNMKMQMRMSRSIEMVVMWRDLLGLFVCVLSVEL
jgi:hypothetical protein